MGQPALGEFGIRNGREAPAIFTGHPCTLTKFPAAAVKGNNPRRKSKETIEEELDFVFSRAGFLYCGDESKQLRF